MKKLISVILLLTLCITGCTGENIPENNIPNNTPLPKPDNILGITLMASEITPTGLKLTIKQEGGNPTGEIQYGAEFFLERYENAEWTHVHYIADGGVAWNQLAYGVEMNSKAEQNINWENIYGRLPNGKYRFSKEFTDFRGTGDFDKYTISMEFEIKAPITVVSNGTETEPYVMLESSHTWDGEYWLAADGLSMENVLAANKDGLPEIKYADDFEVLYRDSNITFHSFSVYDEKTKYLELTSCTDFSYLKTLPKGEYTLGIRVKEQGKYIESEKEFETIFYGCLYKMTK
ncbi:MAG: hypothetical protein Q4B31_00440 [Clostridia bacterium]|nr:hypothetical protein [Clostridia bacterium]